MAEKENDKDGVLVKGTSAADSISNTGSNVTIDAGKGNDTIDNEGDDVLFKYSGGNDLIDGFADDSTLQIASGKMNSVVTSDGKDYFVTVGKNIITLKSAAMLDEEANIVDSKGKAVKFTVKPNFNFTAGDDSAENYLYGIKLNALGGNDFIKNWWASKVTIIGGNGDDTIENRGDDVSISGGTGNDSITNSLTKKVTISGGAGNDVIDNYGSDTAINAGKGNDTIENSDGWYYERAENVLIKYSGGNDLIRGFGEDSTLQIASGTMNSVITTNSSDYFVIVGKNVVTLEGAAWLENYDSINIINSKGKAVKYKVEVDYKLTEGNDAVTNRLSGVVLNALGGNDSITNYSLATINGGKGDDYIDNYSSGSLINGGAGNDTISSTWYSKVNGGAGDDYIVASGCTVNGGKGNDTISPGAGGLIEYKTGDGNDVIRGYHLINYKVITLRIDDGKGTYSTSKSGDDIVVTVGDNEITLVGAASLPSVNINGTKLLTVNNSIKSPVTVDDTTKIIDASSRTKAVKITGNELDNTISGGSKNDKIYGGEGDDSIVGNAGNDKLYGSNDNDTLVGGKGNDTLWGGAGNDKLFGGDGKDVFIYKPGEGTDTIFDYASGDMLQILKTNGKDGGTFTSSTFKNNNLTLAIEGGGKVIFDGVSKGDKFNVNGKSYTLSGTKLK